VLSSAGLLANRSVWAQAPAGPTKSFGYGEVVERAKALAQQPFDAESAKIPAELANL